MCITEIWKSINGYEGFYEVSNLGNVRSVDRISNGRTYSGRVLLKGLNKKGYEQVTLSKGDKQKTKSVHILVGIAFIPNPDNKPQINHKDGVKTNNNIDNLEWNTNSENNTHAYNVLKRKSPWQDKKGSLHGASKPVLKFDKNNVFIEEYPSVSIAAELNNLKHSHISRVIHGVKKSTGGFKWKLK